MKGHEPSNHAVKLQAVVELFTGQHRDALDVTGREIEAQAHNHLPRFEADHEKRIVTVRLRRALAEVKDNEHKGHETRDQALHRINPVIWRMRLPQNFGWWERHVQFSRLQRDHDLLGFQSNSVGQDHNTVWGDACPVALRTHSLGVVSAMALGETARKFLIHRPTNRRLALDLLPYWLKIIGEIVGRDEPSVLMIFRISSDHVSRLGGTRITVRI